MFLTEMQINCKTKLKRGTIVMHNLTFNSHLNKIPLYLQNSKDKNNVFCTNAKNMFSKITNQRY